MYTSEQARKLLEVDGKTFLKWLERDAIAPQISKRDNRIKLFTREQIEQLAERHDRVVRFEDETAALTVNVDERLDALEARMAAFEQEWRLSDPGATPDVEDIHRIENKLDA